MVILLKCGSRLQCFTIAVVHFILLCEQFFVAIFTVHFLCTGKLMKFLKK